MSLVTFFRPATGTVVVKGILGISPGDGQLIIVGSHKLHSSYATIFNFHNSVFLNKKWVSKLKFIYFYLPLLIIQTEVSSYFVVAIKNSHT